MKYHLNLFYNALTFFTRLPAPPWVEYSEQHLNRSSRFFPWVGLLVGAVAALSFWLCAQLFPLPLAALLSMLSTILLTGAFHEDGLADVCDGFGGGWTRDQVLTIMKDSRIGTYGVAGLGLALLLKHQALVQLTDMVPILLLAHTLSRFAAVTLLYTDCYVRQDPLSKARPLAQQISVQELAIAALPVLLCLLLLDARAWLVLVPVLILRQGLAAYFRRRIGGYTGDCLGACQQLCELAIYLFFCLPWFIAPVAS